MSPKIKRLQRRLRRLKALLEARVHSVAWRSFRPQPWENAIGGGFHSDPTYAAVEFLDSDPVYKRLKAKYREVQRELAEALCKEGD